MSTIKPQVRSERVALVMTGDELATLEYLTARRAQATPHVAVSRASVIREALAKLARADADQQRAA